MTQRKDSILGNIEKLPIKQIVKYDFWNINNINKYIEAEGIGWYCKYKPKKYDYDYRYFLNINIKNINYNKKTLVTLLMNPSKTFPDKGFDYTIQNIIRIAYKMGYSKIVILNSSPYIDGDSNAQISAQVNKNFIKNNTNYIKRYIVENKVNSKFLIAWGGNSKKITNEQEYLKILYDNEIKIYAYHTTTNHKPCHASILVENGYKYVSDFLKDNNKGFVPLEISFNKKSLKYILKVANCS